MNNLRKSSVMLFIGVMVFSMLLIPFTPLARVDSQVSQNLPNSEQEFIQKWADRVENDMVGEKMDPILISYMETGIVDESMYTNLDGSVKLLLYVAPGFDIRALDNIAEVRWQIDLVVSRVASVDVHSISALRQIEAMDGIKYVQADRYIDREINGGPGAETDIFHINDVVGSTGALALGYDGSGAIVAIDDSGADFSQPDMRGTEYSNGTYPMSYDPSSVGLTRMVIANGSYVANTTAWLAKGYLLTYNITNHWYVDVSGWDPVCNNIGGGGSTRTLLSGFIGIYEGAWGIANATEFVMSEMWKDWEIPAPAGGQNYTFGWAFQQRTAGYTKLFAPSMVYNGNLIIDWNGTLAWTTMWMEGFYWETSSFQDLADRAMYTGMMDWSFVDDIAAGYVHNKSNNILGADLDDDGTWDVGIGSLSWAYDDLGYLPKDYGVFFGITPDGLAWNCLHNHDSNHGQWTASAVASRGVYDYEVYDNTTTVTTTSTVGGVTTTTTTTLTTEYKLPGVATGSKIIECKGISSGGGLMADFWGAGFHLNTSAGPYGNLTYWTYSGDGPSHKADIVSNSWGWGPGGSYLQLYYYALMYDIASVPNVLGYGYPGTLFVFSSGNNGGSYGTSGTPSGSYSVVSVGASITSHYYQTLYGPEQTDNQAIYFSSQGPAFTGVVKPDVMAPGYRGVSPQPFHDIWMDADYPYYWWQGTSLSCPVAAGVAAIIIDAYVAAHGVKPTPQILKDILLSSADDMGLDPFIQGHGLVNALAAVTAIEAGATNKYFFESDTYANYGKQIAEAWDWYNYDWDPFGIYLPSPTPVGMESSSIFFGSVDRTDVVTANLDVLDFGLNPRATSAFSGINAWHYTQYDKFSYTVKTGTYKDTNFVPSVTRPISFNLFDNMTAQQELDFWAANYITINVAFSASKIPIYARLFDWNDVNMDGKLNYWNTVTDTGDIVDHVARYTDACNLLTINVASASTMAAVFDYVPALQIEDAKAPTTVTWTMTIWQRVTDTAIGTADGTTGIDVTLTVPSNAEYGIHEGSIQFVDAGGWSHQVPYSYMVDFNMTSSYGTNQTLVDGAGVEITPYDTGTATTSFIKGSTSTQESGGTKVFRVNIPYDITLNASVLVMRAEWQNSGTIIDFQLRNLVNSVKATTNDRPTSGSAFSGVPTSALKNTIIWDNGATLINGSYWFLVYVHKIDGADVPENIKITMQLYNHTTLTTASIYNTWTSRDMTTPTTFTTSDVLAGDHVVIANNWTIPAVSGLPEYSIKSTKLSLLSGLYVQLSGTYVDPNGVDVWQGLPLTSPAFVWETVEGITAGDNVRVSIDAQSAQDPAFDVWDWDDANSNGLVDLDELGATSLLNKDDGGSGTPESGSYTAAVSGDIAIRVYAFDYCYVAGAQYVVTVDTRASVDKLSGSGTPKMTQFDTYLLLRNITMQVIYTCYTSTNKVFTRDLGQVTFANFFKPHVTVNAPVETSTDHFNLTWSSTDQNADDVIYYSIWLSRDGGESYVLLRQNTTSTNYTWNSASWVEATYILRVRAYSCDFTNFTTLGVAVGVLCDVSDPPAGYWPGDYTDAFSAPFAAGAIPPPVIVTTTTTTTTSTTTSVPVTPIDPLLIGLVAGIGVGVVVVLILFLIKKK